MLLPLLFLPIVNGQVLEKSTEFNSITTLGNNVFWASFVIFALNTIGLFSYSFTKSPELRFFDYITSTICATSSLFYLGMASGIGVYKIEERDFIMIRYIHWMLTTPLLLIALSKLSKVSNVNIFILAVLDILMIIGGFFGAISSGIMVWAFFAFSSSVFVPIIYFLNEDFEMIRATRRPRDIIMYQRLGYYLSIFWMIYPIVWILGKTHSISVDQEIISFSVLDFMAKSVFCTWIVCIEPHEFTGEDLPQLEMN
jgi:bacteriorhodopsin